MTLNELASAIHNDIVQGLRGKTDTVIPIKQLEKEIVVKRNSLIKKYSLQGMLPIQELVQTISCIPVNCEDIAKCCSGIKSGTKGLKFTIPMISTVFMGDSIPYIGPIDRSVSWKIYYDNSFIYHQYRRFNNRPFVWINLGSKVDGMVDAYVFNQPYIENVTIDIVAEDPYKAYTCCIDKKEVEFPAPMFIQDEIKSSIVEQFIRYYKATNPMIVMPNDQTSNNNA